jgi:alpha,alpha-trehalase
VSSHPHRHIVLEESRLIENPVDRLSRMIRNTFWNNLTRRLDADGIEVICADPKDRTAHPHLRIYVPAGEPEMFEYYKRIAASKPHIGLDVQQLPKDITPEYVRSLNDKPGALALAMEKTVLPDGTADFKAIPFVVPGARFNEVRALVVCKVRWFVCADASVALQLGQLLYRARSRCRR